MVTHSCFWENLCFWNSGSRTVSGSSSLKSIDQSYPAEYQTDMAFFPPSSRTQRKGRASRIPTPSPRRVLPDESWRRTYLESFPVPTPSPSKERNLVSSGWISLCLETADLTCQSRFSL